MDELLTLSVLHAPFQRYAENDMLYLPFCVVTNQIFWPPSFTSPFVDSGEVEWRPVSKVGVVRAKIEFERCFVSEFESLLPYGVALVEFAPTARLLAFAKSPKEIEVGKKAKIALDRVVKDGPIIPVIILNQGS